MTKIVKRTILLGTRKYKLLTNNQSNQLLFLRHFLTRKLITMENLMTTSLNRPSLAPAKPGQGSSVLQGSIRAPLGELSTNTNSLPMRLSQRPPWNQVAPFIIEVFLPLFFAPIYLSKLHFSRNIV